MRLHQLVRALSLALLVVSLGLLAGCGNKAKPKATPDGMLSQMFPDLIFSVTGGGWRDQNQRTFIIEQAISGSFTGKGAEELLLVVSRPREEMAQAEGFYSAFLAVFDKKGQRMLSDVNKKGGGPNGSTFLVAHQPGG